MSIQPHAVHRLYEYRQSLSTKPYASRGKNLIRCGRCLLEQSFCTCEHRRLLPSKAAFALVMYDAEVLKPSNSGRLIADLIPDTHAFLWSRTQPDPQLLALLENPDYQPYLVFPGEYALPGQEVVIEALSEVLANQGEPEQAKRPLFILLDGSWREAVKMFRKSSYLHQLPMLSFSAETLARYQLRKGSRDFQMGTAEVAILTLQSLGEEGCADALDTWFKLFISSSLATRSRLVKNKPEQIQILKQQFARQVADLYSEQITYHP